MTTCLHALMCKEVLLAFLMFFMLSKPFFAVGILVLALETIFLLMKGAFATGSWTDLLGLVVIPPILLSIFASIASSHLSKLDTVMGADLILAPVPVQYQRFFNLFSFFSCSIVEIGSVVEVIVWIRLGCL